MAFEWDNNVGGIITSDIMIELQSNTDLVYNNLTCLSDCSAVYTTRDSSVDNGFNSSVDSDYNSGYDNNKDVGVDGGHNGTYKGTYYSDNNSNYNKYYTAGCR